MADGGVTEAALLAAAADTAAGTAAAGTAAAGLTAADVAATAAAGTAAAGTAAAAAPALAGTVAGTAAAAAPEVAAGTAAATAPVLASATPEVGLLGTAATTDAGAAAATAPTVAGAADATAPPIFLGATTSEPATGAIGGSYGLDASATGGAGVDTGAAALPTPPIPPEGATPSPTGLLAKLGNMSTADWLKAGGQLTGGLSGAKSLAGSGSSGPTQSHTTVQGTTGHPSGGAANLSQVVQNMKQRRNMYIEALQKASGQPYASNPGLLGY